MARRKRKSPSRLEGKKLLEAVTKFELDCGEEKSVTAARKYIHDREIPPPALILVRRNEHTIDRFFWAHKGLFTAQYVEENHFLFPSLRVLQQDEPDSLEHRLTSRKPALVD